MPRQQNGPCLGTHALQFARRNQTVHQRHTDIQHGNIGLHLRCDADQLLSISRFPGDLEAFALEKRLDALAHQDVIIGKHDLGLHIQSSRGTLIKSEVPWPGDD